ncbi:hypothetical protein SEA_LEWANDO_75 [Arthrobacter phage Lewando]|nr:hypothetical protein SEA_LEWANDO_75 [Arthrobacter phage Lewando]
MTEYVEIPIEKVVDGEVVTVDTKALPIIVVTPKEEDEWIKSSLGL